MVRAFAPKDVLGRAATRRRAASAASGLVVLAVMLSACGGEPADPTPAPSDAQPIDQLLAAHTDEMLAIPGIVGLGIGECAGAPCIRVFAETEAASLDEQIPSELDGYPVEVDVTGPIVARDVEPG